MTNDAWKSLIVKVLLMILTPLAAQLHFNDGATLAAFAADLADIAVLLYGVYSHWGMDKVAAVAKVLLVAFLVSLFLAPRSYAADNLAVKMPSLVTGSACTPTSCSGPYIGGGIGGVGTNLDVIGNGLNGSAFAGGVIPTIKFGYLYAQNNWLFGAEASLAYQTSTSTTVAGVGGNQNGLLFTQGVKFGGNFSALLGQAQSPITIPPALANSLINVYAQVGAAEHQFVGGFVSGAYGGAGVLFDVGPHSFIDVDYKNIQYGATKNGPSLFNSENVFTVSFNYKF